MLTIPFSDLPARANASVWVIELDTEHGHVQTFGQAEVQSWPPPQGPMIMSAGTGGCYEEPQTLPGGVELWNAEEHYLAVFSSEQKMREGARLIADAFGDQLPVGIYRELTGA